MQDTDPKGSSWAAPRAKVWRRRRSWGIVFAVLAALGLLAQIPALPVDEPHTYIYTLQPRYHVTSATPPAVAVQRMDHLEWGYINRPELSLIAGSWRLLGASSTWTPPSGVSPELVAQRSVTVAPHTWWRLLALQGAPAAILLTVCALLAVMAATCLTAALRLSG